uniref:Lipocalin n=1 Tax=Rhipicephalus zambeziensis TaxID=60191 RepID=A0A224YCB7_9ACAR
MFNCWTTQRTKIDHDARTATYLARFPTVRRTLAFHVKAERNSPRFTYTLDDDPNPKEGVFYYTDYKNCVVEDLEYHGRQCVLWVASEVRHSVPRNCIKYFDDICGAGVPKHSKDLCTDD